MSSVINTNIAATRTHNVYNRNNDYMNAAMTRVATGMKINSAKDGASTWAISEKMRERIRANDQANQNIQNDTALIKTAQGGVGNTIDILETLKERAINASNDSNMSIDRTAIATEVQQLIKQIDDNAAKVKFNGRTLLMGNAAEDTAAASASDSTGKTVVETTNAAEMEKYNAAVEEATKAWEATHTQAEDDVSTQLSVSSFALSAFGGLVAYNASADPPTSQGDTVMKNVQDASNSATKPFDTSNATDRQTVNLTWKAADEDGNIQDYSATFDFVETDTLSAVLTGLQNDIDNNANGAVHIALLQSGDNVLYSSDDADRVTDANGDDLTASAAGIYFVGAKGAISNVKLTFTTGAAGSETDNNDANGIISISEVQEAAASSDTTATKAEFAGDHTIYGFKGITKADGTTAADASTALKDLKMDGNSIFTTDPTASGKIKVTYGDGDNDYVELDGNKLVSDLTTELKAKGINVQLLGKNDQFEDVDSTKIYDTQHENQMFRAPEAGLYFVSGAENGTNGMAPTALTKISFSATDVNGDDVAIKGGDASYVMEFDNSTEADLSGITKPGANNSTLMFYIGGEANFGMTAELGKMTADNLFQDTKYTDASGASKTFTFTQYSDFSDLFLTKEGAQAALSVIDTALTTALNEQTKLGAIENRLGYASDNIVTMNENLEAADSAMRDSDIAKEMTTYMKYAVLSQASQYMLAQAGQNAFQVLNLLQQ